MNKKFIAPLLVIVCVVLLVVSAFGQGKRKPSGGPNYDNGNCGSCYSRSYNRCVNAGDSTAQQACWDIEIQNCYDQFGCAPINNPFAP